MRRFSVSSPAAPLLAPVFLLVALVARAPLRALAATSAGIVAPFVLEVAGYAAIGQLPALLFANGGATLARASGLRSGVLTQNFAIFAKHLQIFGPAVEFAPFAIGHRFTLRSALVTFGWLAAGLVSIVAVGEFYSRQFLLVCAPVALIGGLGLRRFATWLSEHSIDARIVTALVFAATFAMHGYFETRQAGRVALGRAGFAALRVPDRFDAVVDEIACVRKATDRLYLISLSPDVYDLVGARAPTRFAFTDHLLDDRMAVMIGVDPARELERIFATRPEAVVAGDEYRGNPQYSVARVRFIEDRLARDYRPIARSNRTTFYARRDANALAERMRGCTSTPRS